MNQADNKNEPARGLSSRRQLLSLTGGGIALMLCGPLHASGQTAESKRILKHGDRINIGGRGEEIIQKAYELGYEYEKQHGGCARCTVAALQDAISFVVVDESLFRGSTCLDGGATPTETQNCGAFTGAGMVIGYVCGSTRGEEFEGDPRLAHELLHRVYDRFKEEYGTVLCEDVKKGAKADCPKVVARAARWTAEVLLAEFTDDAMPQK